MVVLLKFWIFVNGNYGEVLRKRVSNVNGPYHVATNAACIATND